MESSILAAHGEVALCKEYGEVAEWLKALVLKTSRPKGLASSNLALSASKSRPVFPVGFCLNRIGMRYYDRMKERLTELLGWYGVVAIVVAYILISFGAVASNSFAYQLLNLTGAVGIVVDALSDKNYQPAILNTIWFVVAAIAIIRVVVGA